MFKEPDFNKICKRHKKTFLTPRNFQQDKRIYLLIGVFRQFRRKDPYLYFNEVLLREAFRRNVKKYQNGMNDVQVGGLIYETSCFKGFGYNEAFVRIVLSKIVYVKDYVTLAVFTSAPLKELKMAAYLFSFNRIPLLSIGAMSIGTEFDVHHSVRMVRLDRKSLNSYRNELRKALESANITEVNLISDSLMVRRERSTLVDIKYDFPAK